jgi:hypothetical protein
MNENLNTRAALAVLGNLADQIIAGAEAGRTVVAAQNTLRNWGLCSAYALTARLNHVSNKAGRRTTNVLRNRTIHDTTRPQAKLGACFYFTSTASALHRMEATAWARRQRRFDRAAD